MNNFIVGQVTPDMLTHLKWGELDLLSFQLTSKRVVEFVLMDLLERYLYLLRGFNIYGISLKWESSNQN